MPSMHGVVTGDSQVSRSCLPLTSVETCKLSFGVFDAVCMAEAVPATCFQRYQRVDFAVMLVERIFAINAEPQAICDTGSDHADVERKIQKARSLNRELTATLKRLPCVRTLNAEHRFPDSSKEP
ncbi:hypothetical protein MTO96_030737 [Rhipicephalus appendiculatus]